jgi:tetratricopeptide (TPR) repeat protein
VGFVLERAIFRTLARRGNIVVMTRLPIGSVTAIVLTWSGAVFGQAPAAPAPAPAAPPAAAPPAAAPAAKAPSAPANTGMKDPRGPFWDALNRGDAAYTARDFEGAIKAYREAIEKEAQNPLGHYRLGEAQLAKGDMNEAEQSWQAGLRFAGKDEKLRAKLLFVLADLRERQKNYDEATSRWKEYEKHAKSQPTVKAFPATATERQKRITVWKQISTDSAAVKERIEKRLKETEESMRKSSK